MNIKILFSFLAVFLVMAGLSHGDSMKGSFYVSVDDRAVVYLNGKQVHEANINESYSPVITVSEGDRIIVRLFNAKESRRFMFAFLSDDGKKLINFRTNDGRILQDQESVDFTAEQFASWKIRPLREKPMRDGEEIKVPIRTFSQWMWGDAEQCSLAFVVSRSMFSNRTR